MRVRVRAAGGCGCRRRLHASRATSRLSTRARPPRAPRRAGRPRPAPTPLPARAVVAPVPSASRRATARPPPSTRPTPNRSSDLTPPPHRGAACPGGHRPCDPRRGEPCPRTSPDEGRPPPCRRSRRDRDHRPHRGIPPTIVGRPRVGRRLAHRRCGGPIHQGLPPTTSRRVPARRDAARPTVPWIRRRSSARRCPRRPTRLAVRPCHLPPTIVARRVHPRGCCETPSSRPRAPRSPSDRSRNPRIPWTRVGPGPDPSSGRAKRNPNLEAWGAAYSVAPHAPEWRGDEPGRKRREGGSGTEPPPRMRNPAATYSPRGNPPKYHRRWWA